jgi:valyl-tRNA synthetase
VLEAILRLAHPFMPFITEEIWQRVAPLAGISGDTIMLAAFPQPEAEKLDAVAEADVQWLKEVITAIRNIRGEMRIPPGKALPLYLHNGDEQDRRRLEENRNFLSKMARLENIIWLTPEQSAPPSVTQLVGRMEILVPMAGLIDKTAELERLGKEIQKLKLEVGRAEQRLKNPGFADRAPADVVAKEKEKLNEYRSQLARLEEQAEKIKYL